MKCINKCEGEITFCFIIYDRFYLVRLNYVTLACKIIPICSQEKLSTMVLF